MPGDHCRGALYLPSLPSFLLLLSPLTPFLLQAITASAFLLLAFNLFVCLSAPAPSLCSFSRLRCHFPTACFFFLLNFSLPLPCSVAHPAQTAMELGFLCVVFFPTLLLLPVPNTLLSLQATAASSHLLGWEATSVPMPFLEGCSLTHLGSVSPCAVSAPQAGALPVQRQPCCAD